MPKLTFFNLPAEKQQRIEAAAISEFLRYPYQDSTINRIIQGAGIPPGSFYQYFEDKKDIFFHILEKEIVMLTKNLDGVRLHSMFRDRFTWKENQRLMETHMTPQGNRLIHMLGLAPACVRRDWAFDVLLARHHNTLYDLAQAPDAAKDNPLLEQHKDFFIALGIGSSILVNEYTDDTVSTDYYALFVSIFWAGLANYRPENPTPPLDAPSEQTP